MVYVSVKVKLCVYCKVQTYRSIIKIYIIVFVCILPKKAVPEMTYTVSGGMLNPTHSLTQQQQLIDSVIIPTCHKYDVVLFVRSRQQV